MYIYIHTNKIHLYKVNYINIYISTTWHSNIYFNHEIWYVLIHQLDIPIHELGVHVHLIQGVSKKMIHFSIGNIFVSPEDIAKPNI